MEWGWAYEGDANAIDQTALTAAQVQFYPQVIQEIRSKGRFSVNAMRWAVDSLRPLLTFGFGDMFYYVSEEGKFSVRRAVAKQIVECLDGELDEPISLTLIGHSAGSVILFDFAFYLYFEDACGAHDYLSPEGTCCPDRHTEGVMRKLHERAMDGRIRVRRLFTFGSPISLLAFRSNAVVNLIAAKQRIEPKLHGLTQQPPAFGPALRGPRWLNIWDRDDPISWPVAPFMAQPADRCACDPVVIDKQIDIYWHALTAHSNYWDDYRIAATLARAW